MDSDTDFEGLAEVWLPESPDHRVTSIVSFDPSHGARLQLLRGPAPPTTLQVTEAGSPEITIARTLDGFEQLVDEILAGQRRRIPKLIGLLDGTPFLLLDGTLRLISSPASGPPLVEVTADAVLVGMPNGTGPTTFDRMVVSTHWLTELSAVGGLRSQMAWPEGGSGHVRYSASTEPVDEVQGVDRGRRFPAPPSSEPCVPLVAAHGSSSPRGRAGICSTGPCLAVRRLADVGRSRRARGGVSSGRCPVR